MTRAWLMAAFGLLGALATGVHAQRSERVQWIWLDEGDPAVKAPAGTVHFRRVFKINRDVQNPVDEGVLDITADGSFTVWVNGTPAGKGADSKRVFAFDVRKLLVHGDNAVAVEVKNTGGPAGLLVRLGYVPNGQSKLALVSDGSWKASKTAAAGWEKVLFDDASWKAARVIGPYNVTGPWKNLAWDSGGDDRFAVPPGFRVEEVVKVPDFDKTFSLVNLTFDDKGRLLVSRESGRGGGLEKGPVYLCTDPDKNGIHQTVKVYCDKVTNCQGMCWVNDALLLVGDGPEGVGLYRVRDTKKQDRVDEVTLLHKFPLVDVPGYHRSGGMGEHGPHAIIHGPDNWLYLVAGNHAWARPEKLAANPPLRRWPNGQMGPDQGKPGSTEDVLLPRLNDGRGHASNILAPGGTIWRLDHQGKNMSLVAAGFRNHYDAAFNPHGELFTFDSDMEWDESLPWYRAVRACHCPPGADFVLRTGAANTPDYYIDSLPPAAETGRGSPVGVEFYDHVAFPEKYRGAFFMADWAIGVIFAAHLERNGASYKAKVERFCSGAPMNVTDLVVGPDGGLYFTMGGRGTQGGVYRIAYDKPAPGHPRVQLLSAWSRSRMEAGKKEFGSKFPLFLGEIASGQAPAMSLQERLQALHIMQNHAMIPDSKLLLQLGKDRAPEIRAQAAYLLGVNGYAEGKGALLAALKDSDALVRRRACEALIRAGFEPPVTSVWPLLGDSDRFVRHAARLVVERIDAGQWAKRIGKEPNDLIAWNAIIALCHVNQAAPYAEQIFGRLRGAIDPKGMEGQALLDYLRTVQMALIHVPTRPIWTKAIAIQCEKYFPHKDWRANRELAILLTQFAREGHLAGVHSKLLTALHKAKDDRLQQMHYFYCLRLLKESWQPGQAGTLAGWYDGTRTWTGGHSFHPFLENIFKDALDSFSLKDRAAILVQGEKTPLATLVLAQRLQVDRQAELLPELNDLAARLTKVKTGYKDADLARAVEDALTRTALAKPSADTWPHIVRGLGTTNPVLKADVLASLHKSAAAKPKPDDSAAFRTLLVATPKFANDKERWQAIELMRQWTGRSFGAEPPRWEAELNLWKRWFAQTFPKEPALPDLAPEKIAESKYKLEELLTFLDGDGRKGDVTRGRAVFEKAQCLRCHKFGKEGEGVGPDLTALSKRFKRADVLEALVHPSKVISDQYRSVTITTTRGQSITGLAAVQGDTVTVLLSDANKVTLKKNEIESQVVSLISVMPERLLDTLTRQEIADLFAFMESDPK